MDSFVFYAIVLTQMCRLILRNKDAYQIYLLRQHEQMVITAQYRSKPNTEMVSGYITAGPSLTAPSACCAEPNPLNNIRPVVELY